MSEEGDDCRKNKLTKLKDLLNRRREIERAGGVCGTGSVDAVYRKELFLKAAAEAAKPTASEWRTRLAEQAAAKRVVGATAASKALSKKQKAATAQSDCTGSPKYDALCVCDFCMI